MRRYCAVVVAAVLLGAPTVARAAEPPRIVTNQEDAKAVFVAYPKVARWLEHYPPKSRIGTARFMPKQRVWQVSIFSKEAGEIARGRISQNGQVVQAWVGPEVAWPLALGNGLGGRLNEPLVWGSLCLVFFLGLANLRRLLSLRNLDLLVFLGFSAYLAFFNNGRVFASAIAAAVPFVYLIARCGWIGATNRVSPSASSLPVWLLVAVMVLLLGFRVGLNTEGSMILDVGYAGVIGADRLASGVSPYGSFPVANTGRPCGPERSDGEVSEWIQANGRCESPNPFGDTYGPVNYHAYLPGLAIFGWSGKWDNLPAAHFTTLLFDLLAILGLGAVGYRFGGTRLAVLLMFAWVANPFTQYASSSNTNDAIMPALLIWGFWAATSNVARGVLGALGAWAKLAGLIIVPLWATYPGPPSLRGVSRFALGFAVTTLIVFWVLFVDGDPVGGVREFYDRTFEKQLHRASPFSLWDWGRYHAAGIPDLKWLQQTLQVLLVIAAVAVAFVPRRKSPLQLAALTAALLMGFELVLTHWAALYIAWFFPFLALAVVAGQELGGTVPARSRAAPVPRPLMDARAETA